MNLQSFTEELLKVIDTSFEENANQLLNEARQFGQKTAYIAGKMDGLHDAVSKIKQTYKLFVNDDKSEPEEQKSLY